MDGWDGGERGPKKKRMRKKKTLLMVYAKNGNMQC